MKHVILVKLEIEAASWEDAMDAVEYVLDNGTFQDEINEHFDDGMDGATGGVLSATCDSESAYRNVILEKAAAVADREAACREDTYTEIRAGAFTDMAKQIRRLKR